ncbi:hypothetical protein HAX54_030024 [Datura stramonium]|uniref:Uncharacterized protein n=1 Tax=Datura stramonium TaxID=4076 RepID=A0ABS8V6Y8_DATST|nr:hypothetical protein [Datura stramonium]
MLGLSYSITVKGMVHPLKLIFLVEVGFDCWPFEQAWRAAQGIPLDELRLAQAIVLKLCCIVLAIALE